MTLDYFCDQAKLMSFQADRSQGLHIETWSSW